MDNSIIIVSICQGNCRHKMMMDPANGQMAHSNTCEFHNSVNGPFEIFMGRLEKLMG